MMKTEYGDVVIYLLFFSSLEGKKERIVLLFDYSWWRVGVASCFKLNYKGSSRFGDSGY